MAIKKPEEYLEVLCVCSPMIPPLRKISYLKYFSVIGNNGCYLFQRSGSIKHDTSILFKLLC